MIEKVIIFRSVRDSSEIFDIQARYCRELDKYGQSLNEF